MDGRRVLITGGAGFVGSHIADELLERGCKVRVLDCLDGQVHGDIAKRPEYLSEEIELIVGDVRNHETLRQALRDVDVVYHLAASVGVGQSMYEVEKYTDNNNVSTATLLEALIARPVEQLVVASSMSVYGEGLYRDSSGNLHDSTTRSYEQLRMGSWDPCDDAGEALIPVPTPESKRPQISSVYALTKYDQEQMCLMIGRAYHIPVTCLRFFNIYGPRQALSNPYTGVLAIFASRLLNHQAPLVFEDGEQMRDFVSVHDIKRACVQALDYPSQDGLVLNIGSGRSYRILEIASVMSKLMSNDPLEPEITGRYRSGDVRHCFSDISLAEKTIGYRPRVQFEEGINELVDWLAGQTPSDLVTRAYSELSSRGLTI
jgi:dTDP-L-rhamnose 4-epimerase